LQLLLEAVAPAIRNYRLSLFSKKIILPNKSAACLILQPSLHHKHHLKINQALVSKRKPETPDPP
jgi:hypothetical protein